MKYYIRAINTETKKSMIMETPVFTNRKKAETWAEKFSKVMTKVGRAEVVAKGDSIMELVQVGTRTAQNDERIITETVYKLGGYTVCHKVFDYVSGVTLEDITVNAGDDDYLPRIYYSRMYGHKVGHFEIQTTSYGALSVDEAEKMVAGYIEALDAVKALTKRFC